MVVVVDGRMAEAAQEGTVLESLEGETALSEASAVTPAARGLAYQLGPVVAALG